MHQFYVNKSGTTAQTDGRIVTDGLLYTGNGQWFSYVEKGQLSFYFFSIFLHYSPGNY